MRRLCRNVTISVGDAFEEPLDPSDVGASWAGETETRPATSTSNVGLLRVPVEEIYALQPVTQRLLDDSRFDIGSYITGKIVDKFGRSEGAAFVVGDAVKKPKGFTVYPIDTAGDFTRAAGKLQYFPSLAATTISADSIRNLYWGLRAVHRQSATWLMSSATANVLDTLKDGVGQPLWRNGMTAGAPPSLLGLPVAFSEDMPSVSAGNLPIALGDFSVAYLIVEKAGIRYLRDPLTSKPNVLFYAYRRVGGAVANFDAVKLMRIGLT
jgi:HK97 family phage major capsid protein